MTSLSILDLVRVTQATDARGAFDNARDLAAHAERWGSRGDNRLLSRVISTYAFPTYGPRGMDFARSEAKIILDHFERIEPDDVTGRFYSADPAINRKCEIMEKWIAWLEHRCADAIRKDGLLTDSKPLSETNFQIVLR